MKISTIIIGILLFAIATMIIYVWGLARQKNQEKDLLNLLFSNGQSKIKKYMKNHDSITQKEAERLCEGLTAKLPFSQNKAVCAVFPLRIFAFVVGNICFPLPFYRRRRG